jgi:hypothetical protein
MQGPLVMVANPAFAIKAPRNGLTMLRLIPARSYASAGSGVSSNQLDIFVAADTKKRAQAVNSPARKSIDTDRLNCVVRPSELLAIHGRAIAACAASRHTPALRREAAMIVDAQVRLWKANPPERPWPPNRVAQPPEPFTIGAGFDRRMSEHARR